MSAVAYKIIDILKAKRDRARARFDRLESDLKREPDNRQLELKYFEAFGEWQGYRKAVESAQQARRNYVSPAR